MSDRGFQALGESLNYFGQVATITVRDHPTAKGHYQVLDGEHRYKQSDVSAWCTVVEVSDADAKKLTVILNEGGKPEEELLFRLLAEIAADAPTEDAIVGLPYEVEDFEELIRQGEELLKGDVNRTFEEGMQSGPAPKAPVVEDDFEPTEDPKYIPRVAPGEVWQLGRHFVACGDCTVEENVRGLMAIVILAKGGSESIHPTQKPIALAAWFFEKYGKPKDLIIDPFLGSGMSLIAAEQGDRTVIGFEISEHYCSLICDRWEALTGGTAVRVGVLEDEEF
jgi:hypothetical protein